MSSECIRAFENNPRVASVRLIERVPPYTLRFSAERLRRFASVDEALLTWSDEAVALERSADGAVASVPSTVRLDESPLQRAGIASAVKQRLGLRSRLARSGYYDKEYARRLRAVRETGNLVLNAAGEFWEAAVDVPLRHLVDVYFAQMLGCRTAIINHTFSVRDKLTLELARRVYARLGYVSVRDQQSRQNVVDLGVAPERVNVTSDLVFLAEPQAVEGAAPARVAICPNTAFRSELDRDWGLLIEELRSQGASCALCSNDFPTDGDLLERLASRFSLPIVGRGLGYRDYAGVLGKFDLVISSRLHTGILAMTASTPVLPVEGLTFKITGAMKEIRNPLSVVDFASPGWLERAKAQLQSVLASGGAEKLRRETAALVDRQRTLAKSAIGELLDALS